MAKIADLPAAEFIKLIYAGDSGTGKTGSLVSLVQAGYDLKILDMDNGLSSLRAYAKQADPALLDKIDAISLRDKFKADPIKGLRIDGAPKAYTNALKHLNKWDDDSIPSEWGNNTIFVVDSFTAFCRAAFHWAQGMNPSAKDPRQWYGTAQESAKTVLELLTAAEFKCHVIVISHIDIWERPDGTVKGYASSIGKALGPQIPKFFDTMVAAESRGTGDQVKRTIQTMPTAMLDLKSPVPTGLSKSLPLATGLATIFETLRKAN